ncbi:MAG: GIY-YIG nuclease family protein [Nitrospirae bacterium]|nr:MAG: GIY-YIG nuclease family protein [Nitrospirota bacterium]
MRILVYILRSLSNGKRYIGITNDLNRRLHEHSSGITKGGQVLGRFELLHTEEYAEYSAARNREKFLKSGQGRQWLNITFGKHGPPEAGKACALR